MIKYKFIACAYDLELNNTMNRGIKVLENIRISNSSDKVSQMFHPLFKNALGSLEYNYLVSKPYFYAEGEINDEAVFYDDEIGLKFLDDFMKKTQLIGSFLWLVKDNSVHTEIGYMQLEKKGEDIKFRSNGRSVIFNNLKGERKSLNFNSKELKFPEIFYKHYFEQPSDSKDQGFKTELFDEIPVYEASRIERAFYLLQAARAQSYLPERISIFTSLLETLFSTSNTEVTHKLKERMAWLLGGNYEEREKIFNDMGVIYGIRSHNVHSSTVPKDANTSEKLILYTEKLENYVREVLLKVLMEEDILVLYQKNEKGKYDNTKLDKFFKSLCLGKVYKEK